MPTRIFHPALLSNLPNQIQLLSENAHHHIARVLRKSVGFTLEVFDGEGHFAIAHIMQMDKKFTKIEVGEIHTSPKPKLHLHLFQAIRKGDRLDYAVQKAVELGVTEVTLFMSTRCDVKLNAARQQKKKLHLQKIIESACEQSRQNYMPALNSICSFDDSLSGLHQVDRARLILSPALLGDLGNEIEEKVSNINLDSMDQISSIKHFEIWVGPEGGFTQREVLQAVQSRVLTWQLGPRIFRTETAPLVALSILQYELGDF